jgi:hypothetical protein
MLPPRVSTDIPLSDLSKSVNLVIELAMTKIFSFGDLFLLLHDLPKSLV